MKTILTYSNLVHGLVSKLDNMQEAGIIDDFSVHFHYNTWEESKFREMQISVNFPYDRETKTSMIQISFEEDSYDEGSVEEFNKGLDKLIQKKYKALEKSHVEYDKIKEHFSEIINKERSDA